MPKRIDRTGQVFGNLIIKKQKIENGINYSLCGCKLCGNETWIRTDLVVSGIAKSCGCMRVKREGRVNKIYGGLKVLNVSNTKNPKALCKCLACGKEKEYGLNWLIKKKPESCGCLNVSDISGMRFGFLEPISPTEEREGGSVVWKCRCHNCGRICMISNAAMTQRGRKHCGCMSSKIHSETCKENFPKGLGKGMIEGTSIFSIKSNKARPESSTGIRGVSPTKNGKYRVRLTFKGKTYYLGTYDTIEDATAARKEAEKKIYGDFLREHGETRAE